MAGNTALPPKFGIAGYASATLVVFGLLFLLQPRSQEFTHGTELVWVYAYSVPLLLEILALILGGIHLLRGRLRSIVAWAPVLGSLTLVCWLLAYLYFGAFRSV